MVVTSAEVIFVSDFSNSIVGFFFVLLFTIFHSVLLQVLVELNLDAVDLVVYQKTRKCPYPYFAAFSRQYFLLSVAVA